ncbi:MAG TPA: ribonuclease III [Flavobacterium sp.]|nr:ribonuclease III [Flavobacterium sp.]
MKWFKKIFNRKSRLKKGGIFYTAISAIVQYQPEDIVLFETAFTHRSFKRNNDKGEPVNYERLEFLGDALLGSVIAAYLYQNAPKGDEGYLTQMRSKIVSRSHLNAVGKKLQLEKLLKSKVPFKQFGDNIYGNLLEALIGAVYVDAGFTICEQFIYKNILIEFQDLQRLEKKVTSYKSMFIEYCQKHKKSFRFETIEDNGKDKIKHFMIHLYYEEQVIAKGRATSKKKAEEKAAQRAFYRLQSQMNAQKKK